ncbi:hypothetical protein [Agrococcus sp. SGAir0287]|uniref:hypothetical protein n=1 Tax=Agrococcus sp. SGAir0287 TaxID=2070347 RepID=UPI0010CD3438|nr:hypothetical protein [Agrococcus sp. SGAir0287]QCR20232.1 hypothetical protein C1N71_12960 [Agrococcus sp. SGAir0287]
MLFLAGDDAGPSDPLTADLTPVFQTLGVVGAVVVVLALVVLAVRFARLRRRETIPRALTVAAVVGGAIGFILLVMAIGAGVVVA